MGKKLVRACFEKMRFDVVTIFPELIDAWSKIGVSGGAFSKRIAELICWNPRKFCESKRGDVDDRPYGGGPGMVMLAQPLKKTLEAINQTNKKNKKKVIFFSPTGKKIEQNLIEKIIHQQQRISQYILICGRYEGVDQRFIDLFVDETWSLGDFVNSGGELAAMVLMDAVIRRLPGTLGNQNSSVNDSFMNGLLDFPHFSKPEIFESISVPNVLLSGHHARINEWRRQQSLLITKKHRPDLIQKAREAGILTKQDEIWLSKIEIKSVREG